ncbi:hypothetical protein [Micromonospora inositola]|nr:hypothetical protein [Micromonospora inositola]
MKTVTEFVAYRRRVLVDRRHQSGIASRAEAPALRFSAGCRLA